MPKPERLTSYSRFAILLFIIGGLFGADSLFHLSVAYKLWPLIITILGIGFIGIFRKRDRKEALYLTVGIYLICFSGLALWCDFTRWGTLKTFWPLFIAFLGIALTLAYTICNKTYLWLLIGLLLISTSVVFFFVFSISHDLWWTVFLLAGMSVWIAERDR
jgi:CDP-diglyceride synthetase